MHKEAGSDEARAGQMSCACERDYAHEVIGVTPVRNDLAKARMDDMSWCDKFTAY